MAAVDSDRGLGGGREAFEEAVNHRPQRFTDETDVFLESPTSSVIAWSGQETCEQQQREVRGEDRGPVPFLAVEVGVQDVVVGVHSLEVVVSGGGEYVEVGVYSVEDEVVVEAPPPPDPLLNHQSA